MNNLKNKTVVIFPGRFQPFHIGHEQVYNHLCEKFGVENVWITTSNKTDYDSPLTFNQKVSLIEGFKITRNRIIQCRIPYVPRELVKQLQCDEVPMILALGEKDKDRLAKSSYYCQLNESNNLESWLNKTYIYATPMFADEKNASSIRQQFRSDISEDEKHILFLSLFGQFNESVYHSLTK